MADDVAITPTNDGPYHVQGKFRVVLPSGRELETGDETWLCRCGGSQTKPFCDGTHSKIGFRAAEAAVVEADTGVPVATGALHPVAVEDEVGDGELLGVEVAGQPVVIGRVDGELYAIGGTCSHQQGRLEDGDLDGEVVLCPLHGGGFDLRTGQAVRLPAVEPVPRYSVTVEAGTILVSPEAPAGEAN